ncbi:MAG: small subunit ribosomal protein S9 [Candidatus Berkelbacteria bacterium Licking1014_85]|uniref:30S ribosomal protein S9 n=1 Tax=Candidatus Berkelbacteria bacterium Licking1014_85 TaxID=2017148 RepID=A0A554LLV9_9BACT|nr:MAG: small subunit ribosomal protein S9 [Candidatus Berkelbacteria bacterium Licking1014_85]
MPTENKIKNIKLYEIIATGRRKRATANVKLEKGKGIFAINGKEITQIPKIISDVLKLVAMDGKFDVFARVKGGGKTGQVEAIRLGLARAIIQYDPELKSTLRKNSLVTRDQREKERKKPGLRRARRAPQWAKR